MEDTSQPSSVGAGVAGRVGTAVLFVVSLGVFAPIVWLASAFLAMFAGQRSEAALMVVGYLQIGLVPLSAMVGAILGLVLGLIPRGKAIKRWLIGAAAITLIALVVNVGLALLLR